MGHGKRMGRWGECGGNGGWGSVGSLGVKKIDASPSSASSHPTPPTPLHLPISPSPHSPPPHLPTSPLLLRPAPIIPVPFVDSLDFILSAVEEADDAISRGVIAANFINLNHNGWKPLWFTRAIFLHPFP